MLTQSFYLRETTTVAEDLLGKILCFRSPQKGLLRARITEVEAYLGTEDRACHTFNGRRTPRVQSMYLSGGHAYVYMIYGIHLCLNVVTRSPNEPEAVLIRGAELLDGVPGITNGPGKLCAFFGITKMQDGVPLFSRESPLWIEKDKFKLNPKHLAITTRIGIPNAGDAADWPLRFSIQKVL